MIHVASDAMTYTPPDGYWTPALAAQHPREALEWCEQRRAYGGVLIRSAIEAAALRAQRDAAVEAATDADRLIRYYGILLANYRTRTHPNEITLAEVRKASNVTDVLRAAIALTKGPTP